MGKQLTTKQQLPVNYVQAKQAVAACARIDECKSWADKAVALAAYARQMKDTKMLDDARRIQDRAIRRGGELLQQVKSQKDAKFTKSLKGTAAPINGRAAAGRDAGLSTAQIKQALRVARVPEQQFEALVESDRPPSPKQLAEVGTKKQERPKPEPYRNEWIDWTTAVQSLSKLPACGLDVLAKRNPLEIERLKGDAREALSNLKQWCRQMNLATTARRCKLIALCCMCAIVAASVPGKSLAALSHERTAHE